MSVLSQFFNQGSSNSAEEDIMVYAAIVAGGGGGGNGDPSTVTGENECGGGGGGGMVIQTFTPISYNKTYKIVVGSGGARTVIGNNSSFGAITAIGGAAGGNGDHVVWNYAIHGGEGSATGGGQGGSSDNAGTSLTAGFFRHPIFRWNQCYSTTGEPMWAYSSTSYSASFLNGDSLGTVQNNLFPTIIGGGAGGGRCGGNGGGGGGGSAVFPVDGSGANNSAGNGGRGGYGTILGFLGNADDSWSRYCGTLGHYNSTVRSTSINQLYGNALFDPDIVAVAPAAYNVGGGGGGGNTANVGVTDDASGYSGGGNGGLYAGNGSSTINNTYTVAPANRGGGGGGGSGDVDWGTNTSQTLGGAGGSGVVYIAYPSSLGGTAIPNATTTGSPTLITTKRDWKIYKFTASGTFYLPSP